MFWLPRELGAQLRILRGNANRARVCVTLAHHDAAHGDEGGGGKSVLFRAEQGRDRDVAARAHLPVSLQSGTAAKVVGYQGLVGFGETKFPGQPRVFDAVQERGGWLLFVYTLMR